MTILGRIARRVLGAKPGPQDHAHALEALRKAPMVSTFSGTGSIGAGAAPCECRCKRPDKSLTRLA